MEVSNPGFHFNNNNPTAPTVDLENHKITTHQTSFLSDLHQTRGLNIGFQDLTLTIEKKKNLKVILDKVSGSVKPGRFTALLGPSGSGKSSLLSALAGRTKMAKGLKMTGSITVEDKIVRDWNRYRRTCAFVEQDDLLFPNLTVKETLTIAATLRLPREMSNDDRRRRVEAVIAELGLKKCENSRIGGEQVRGISGGERKRVSIGLEILRGPAVMFLDECTSGLDSFQALRVATTIKELARAGRTIVSSIHQPRSSIFNLFDSVILLSEGKVVFNGEAKLMADHFSSLGYPLPGGFNPPDHALDLVSIDSRTPEIESESRNRLNALLAARPSLNRTASSVYEDDHEDSESSSNIETSETSQRKYEASYFQQFRILTQRAYRNKMRDKGQTIVALFTAIFFGTLLGLVYFQTGKNLSQRSINDKVGILFFIALNQAFGGILSVTKFPLENQIVNRERSAKSYGVLPFFLAKTLIDLPSLLVPFTLTTICYWLAGLKADADVYLQTCFLVMMSYFATASLGLFIASFVSSSEKGTAMGFPLMLIFVLFSGFYANTDLIPQALSWIQWISPIRWVFAALVAIQFAGVQFDCADASKEGCIPTGDALINRLGFSSDSFERSIGFLLGFVLLFHILAYIVIRLRKVPLLTPKLLN